MILYCSIMYKKLKQYTFRRIAFIVLIFCTILTLSDIGENDVNDLQRLTCYIYIVTLKFLLKCMKIG